MAEAVRPKEKYKKSKSKAKSRERISKCEPLLVEEDEVLKKPKNTTQKETTIVDEKLDKLDQGGVSEYEEGGTKKLDAEIDQKDVSETNFGKNGKISDVSSEKSNVHSSNLNIEAREDVKDCNVPLAAELNQEGVSINEDHRTSAELLDDVNSFAPLITDTKQEAETVQDGKSAAELLSEFNESITNAMTLTATVNKENAVFTNEQVASPLSNATETTASEITTSPLQISNASSQMGYADLHQVLQGLALEEAASSCSAVIGASAPVIEPESTDELSECHQQLELMDSRTSVAVKHRKISSQIASCEEQDVIIRPFTEAQLKALYRNAELESNDLFVLEFIEKYQHTENHEFYELVMGYLRSRTELVSSTKAIDELKQKYSFDYEHVWSSVQHTAKAQAKCGDGNPVVGTYEYVKAVYDADLANQLQGILGTLQEKIHETYALHAYASEMSKIQIESYLYRLMAASSALMNIPSNMPVQVYFSALRPPELSDQVEKIKCCISILFSFQRRPIKDQQFIMDTRTWLTKLVAIILRVSCFEDHLFIMNHVLRCPAGISSWAVSYIQIPIPVITQGPYCVGGPFLDHILTVLATLLLPVRAREDFLRQLQVEVSSSSLADREDNIWVLVDSEGEEDEDPNNCWLHWRENDLVAILNQLPFAALFRHLLGVVSVDDVDYYDVKHMTDQEMIRIFSVATHLIYLLREGFRTFNLSRYRQFTKRISQLIRHVMIYITGHLQEFMSVQSHFSKITRLRLQAEYDQLFLRAAYSIFSSQRLGAWQFMAVMPYTWVSVEMLWKILWLLHNDYEDNLEVVERELPTSAWQKRLSDHQLHLKFEERLSEMPDNEAYYLLTAFSNMAISRKAADQSFIETICKEVFQISFLNEHTKSVCFKWGRELLGNIAHKHPFIMSLIVNEVSCSMEQIGKVSIFLFQGLPTCLWQPTENDIQIIIRWLMENTPSSAESQLAQTVLSNMNWGVDEAGEKLFLSISLHRCIAVVLLNAYQKHIPLTNGGFILESVKYAASALTTNLSPEDTFNIWAWEIIVSLRLHIKQMPPCVAQSSNFNPVPDLMQGLNVQSLKWAVKEKHPMAIFIAFAMTNVGHSIADFCQSSENLLRLVELQYYEPLLQILCNVTPLFFNCGHYLWTNKVFMNLVQSLMNADLTYLKMAKNLVISTFPGKFLFALASVIEYQLQMSSKMEWSRAVVVSFWLEVLTTFPMWFKSENILFLLDNILRSSFFEEKETVISILAKKFMNDLAHQGATSTFSSFVSWMTTGAGIPFTLVQKNTGMKFPWLTYAMLEVETQNEQQIKMWRFVLRELANNPNATPESAIKKAAGADELLPPPVIHLPIYRWGQHSLETQIDHPLLPLFWQKFFTFYLQRPPFQPGGTDRGSVGLKFFGDMNDVPFLKKLKKKLEELINYHRKLAAVSSPAVVFPQDPNVSGDDPEQRMPSRDEWEYQHSKEVFHEKLATLYRTFLLWLEEPQLHDPSLYLPALLADYDPNRLLLVIQNNQDPWLEFVNWNEVHTEKQNLMSEWCNRGLEKQRRPKQSHSVLETVQQGVEQLLKRFCTYEDSIPAPNIIPFKPVVAELPPNLFESGRTAVDGLQPSLSILTDYARLFSHRLSSHVALDCGFMELLPQIYRNIETEVCLQVSCHKGFSKSSFSLGSDSSCLGPVSITLRFNEKKLILSAQTKLEQNRTEWLSLLNEALLGPPWNVCCSAVVIETAISELLKSHKSLVSEKGSNASSKFRDVGLSIFYHLCGLMDSDIELYPPTRQFMTSCIEILGHELVRNYGDQCELLLQMILDCPRLVSLLAPHFCPNMTDTLTLVKLYRRVIAIHKHHKVDLTFVVLSKFDIRSWLSFAKPKISERTEVVDAIREVLYEFGMNPPDEFEMITELYRQHLCTLLLHQFPEMYRDVLMLLFRGMDQQTLSVKVWYDVLNVFVSNENASKSGTKLSDSSTSIEIASLCTAFAATQDLLSFQQIQESLENLGKRFMDQRVSSSENLFYGLYTKHSVYVKPFTVFLGIMGCSYVTTFKQQSADALDSQLEIKQFWGVLKNAFSAWILPIQHQDKIWSPWISGQESLGTDVLTIFAECLQYAMITIYAASNLLHYVLELYAEEFAKPHVKDHVLNVTHNVLSTLPWTTFWPDIAAIKLMMKIMNQGILDCIAFLGGVFIKISWPAVVHHIVKQENANTLMQTMSCLLHLHIRLGLEPNALQTEEMPRLIEAAHTYPWHVVDATMYDGALKIFLAGCNPKCVLLEEDEKQSMLLSLLQTAAEFVPGAKRVHPEAVKKQATFVRACIQLLCDCASKNKTLLNNRMELFKDVILSLMSQTEAVLLTGPSQEKIFEESTYLVTEIINVLNISLVTCLQDIALKAIKDWAKAHPHSRILGSCLNSVSRSLASLKHMAVLSEAIIEAYFNLEPDSGIQGCGWAFIHSVMRVPQLTQQALINECVNDGYFLALNGIAGLLQLSCRSSDEEWRVLCQIVEWLGKVKPLEENEYKLMLLWWRVLEAIVRLTGSQQTATIAKILENMAATVAVLGEDKSSQGFLAVIGFGKRSQLSLRFRLVARALHSFLLLQARSYEFRSSSTMSVTEHSNLGLSKHCQIAVTLLEQTKSNKQYALLKEHVQFAINFVQDTRRLLKDYNILLSYFTKSLFSEKWCLKVLVKEDSNPYV